MKNLLVSMAVICAFVLICAQVIMTTQEGWDIIQTESGALLQDTEVVAVPLGEIVLSIAKPNDKIKILDNGKVVGVFDEQEKIITVGDNSLLELDGTDANKKEEITIKSKSSNVLLYESSGAPKQGDKITVEDNLVILARVFVD